MLNFLVSLEDPVLKWKKISTESEMRCIKMNQHICWLVFEQKKEKKQQTKKWTMWSRLQCKLRIDHCMDNTSDKSENCVYPKKLRLMEVKIWTGEMNQIIRQVQVATSSIKKSTRTNFGFSKLFPWASNYKIASKTKKEIAERGLKGYNLQTCERNRLDPC